ncbi:MAG: hypothetical protein CMC07_00850 [Flavobacteriaceae bacterium]|nr:hypothetical protein [Flavobacteriaceae bacterium]HBY67523.1 hypothetical protein [Flavobacteriaceae bacterium]
MDSYYFIKLAYKSNLLYPLIKINAELVETSSKTFNAYSFTICLLGSNFAKINTEYASIFCKV